jgi:CubicO group peptidase (beta-lactamase class C family)
MKNMETEIMDHNHARKGMSGSSLSRRVGWLGLVAMLGCALLYLYPAAAQNTNRNQKVPPRTPQKQPVEIKKTTGVENNAMAKMVNIQMLKEKVEKIAKNIHRELDGNVVGYSFVVGNSLYQKSDAYGQARTSRDGAQRDFRPITKITVASVSKMVTAIAAVRILDKNGVSVDAAIGPYLPSDWSVSNYVKNIKFSQLLSHTSGIKDYGNDPPNDYAALKSFFTQSVSKTTSTPCDPTDAKGNFIQVSRGQGINPKNMTSCYSNYNFAIFRVLLPRVAGFPADPNPQTRPQTFADQYTRLVQQNVFDLVGRTGVACKPPGTSSYAFGYNYPVTKNGFDWGDVSLICGAAGWYLSAEDIAKVLLSISDKDGQILSATAAKDQFETMRTKRLGWDVDSNNELEKNGGWGACDGTSAHCGSISTSIAIFEPVTGPRIVGVLFLNSNISGGPSNGGGAQSVLEKAYQNALTP